MQAHLTSLHSRVLHFQQTEGKTLHQQNDSNLLCCSTPLIVVVWDRAHRSSGTPVQPGGSPLHNYGLIWKPQGWATWTLLHSYWSGHLWAVGAKQGQAQDAWGPEAWEPSSTEGI